MQSGTFLGHCRGFNSSIRKDAAEVRTDVSAFPVLNGLYMGEEGRIMYTMSDGCGKFRHGWAIAWGGWKEGVYFHQMKLSY